MEWLTRSDIALLAIACYVAITSLARLMKRRRDELVADVQRQVDARHKNKNRSSNDKTRDAA